MRRSRFDQRAEAAAALRAQVAAFERGETERERAHLAQLSQLTALEGKLEAKFGQLAGQAVETAHEQFLKRADEKLGASGARNEASSRSCCSQSSRR
jgi:DNA recombination protein RmuC